jgi:hypothetical protein
MVSETSLELIRFLRVYSSILNYPDAVVKHSGLLSFRVFFTSYSSGSQTVRRGAPGSRGLFSGAPRNIVKAS